MWGNHVLTCRRVRCPKQVKVCAQFPYCLISLFVPSHTHSHVRYRKCVHCPNQVTVCAQCAYSLFPCWFSLTPSHADSYVRCSKPVKVCAYNFLVSTFHYLSSLIPACMAIPLTLTHMSAAPNWCDVTPGRSCHRSIFLFLELLTKLLLSSSRKVLTSLC